MNERADDHPHALPCFGRVPGACHVFVVSLALALGAAPAHAEESNRVRADHLWRVSDSGANASFERTVDDVVNRVVRFDPPRFTSSRHRNTGFAFYEGGRLEAVRCERAVSMGLIVGEGVAGQLSIGVCSGAEAERVAHLAAAAPAALDAALEWIKRALMGTKDGFRDPGWKYQKAAGPDGSEIHSFPVAWIGHGIGVIESAVLIAGSGQRAIVVQADVDGMCGGKLRNQTPLCSDTTAALIEIARQLHIRLRTDS